MAAEARSDPKHAGIRSSVRRRYRAEPEEHLPSDSRAPLQVLRIAAVLEGHPPRARRPARADGAPADAAPPLPPSTTSRAPPSARSSAWPRSAARRLWTNSRAPESVGDAVPSADLAAYHARTQTRSAPLARSQRRGPAASRAAGAPQTRDPDPGGVGRPHYCPAVTLQEEVSAGRPLAGPKGSALQLREQGLCLFQVTIRLDRAL